MDHEYLKFEKPIAIIRDKIRELESIDNIVNVNLAAEILELKNKEEKLINQIFSSLSDHQIVQLARHPNRPHSLDHINNLFSNFYELHGDRQSGDCKSIVSGLARFENHPIAIIAQQKGRDTAEKIYRNFGMPKPQGYRKALRIMKLAEKFSFPIISLIDTPGAYPGIDAEENNQSEAIAKNLFSMATLKTPIISIVIGEGSSGGALAIGVADKVFMLEYSIYATISPEGCASILWKDANRSDFASKAMQLTAKKVHAHGLIDGIIQEPSGGAHRNPKESSENIKLLLIEELHKLKQMTTHHLLESRHNKLMMKHLYQND
jgi:acetyl-CoA carboxylase carboxyl transferase subunit alpha